MLAVGEVCKNVMFSDLAFFLRKWQA